MKKRTFLTCVCLVAALMVCVFSVARVDAGTLDKRNETWSNKWSPSNSPNGPVTKFNNNRSAKINAYNKAVNEATKARSIAIIAAMAKWRIDIESIGQDAAREMFENTKRLIDEKWNMAERAAYDTLVNGIRNDYKIALSERADEYRKARKTWKQNFHIKAGPKSYPGAGHKYDKVEGGLLHPKKDQSGLTWEVADPKVYNPDAHHLAGTFNDSKEVKKVDDGKNVGFTFYFRIKGGSTGASTRHGYGALWCTFKVTETSCVEQARRDLGGVTEAQLGSCQALLDQVGFTRQTIQ